MPLHHVSYVVAASFIAGASAAAQAPAVAKWADSLQTLIAAGVASGRPDALDQSLALADRVLTILPNDPHVLHYKGYALYRKANPLMDDPKRRGEAKALLEEADELLERSAKSLAWPETMALRASISGQLIGLGNPLSGMILGPRSDNQIDKALELGPANPRVWMLKGVGTMFKPRVFGGGADNAEKELRKAIDLFAADRPTPPAPRWGHAESYAWLGQVYVLQKKFTEARAAYQQALALDPDNGWVTHVLLPTLEKQAR